MYPDRSTSPVEFKFSKIEFPSPKLEEFNSGLKLHYFNTPGNNAFKIEFILRNANSFKESHLGVNLLISKLFLSGTGSKNASTISELLAQKGAFIDISPSFDYTSIVVHCLKKYWKRSNGFFENFSSTSWERDHGQGDFLPKQP